MEDDQFVVVARGVRKTYHSDEVPVRALRGADLVLQRGEFVALMGPSGSGKSTLLSLIAGLDVPDEGEVTVAGNALGGRNEDERALIRRSHVGMVFQFFNLLEGMTAAENVMVASILAGLTWRQADTRARDLLDLLGLSDKSLSMPGVLSGGQRQRLAIARALANSPTVLLADEPTGALDSAGSQEVMELFRRLHEAGQTILLVTHDETVAERATRILHVHDGRVETDAGVLATGVES
jgi:putative ABC transport system ATP-binding protein